MLRAGSAAPSWPRAAPRRWRRLHLAVLQLVSLSPNAEERRLVMARKKQMVFVFLSLIYTYAAKTIMRVFECTEVEGDPPTLKCCPQQ